MGHFHRQLTGPVTFAMQARRKILALMFVLLFPFMGFVFYLCTRADGGQIAGRYAYFLAFYMFDWRLFYVISIRRYFAVRRVPISARPAAQSFQSKSMAATSS